MSAFGDVLSDKQHVGPLKISRQWPAPEGTQFVEERVTREGGSAAVCRRGRLRVQNKRLQGGPRILRCCKCPSSEFLAVEVVDGGHRQKKTFVRAPPFVSAMKGLPRLLLRRGMFCGIFCGMFLSSGGAIHPAGARKAAPVFEVSEATTTATCWIYTHLNKSGGSTVKTILTDAWGQRFDIYDSIEWQEGDGHLRSVAEDLAHGQTWDVVGGGYAEALRRPSAVDSNCQWFTVFRHPISRLVSAYYYCQGTPTDQTCASEVLSAKHVDLATFAKHWGNYAMRQFALSLVSIDDVLEYSHTDAVKELLPARVERPNELPGWYLVKLYLDSQTRKSNSERSNNEQIPDEALCAMLQPVQDLLRDKYTAIGILEEFDATFSLFNAALDMPGIDWHQEFASMGQRNVDNKHKDDKEATLAEAWSNSEIKKYMQLDLLLYEHAVDVFHEQARAYGI